MEQELETHELDLFAAYLTQRGSVWANREFDTAR